MTASLKIAPGKPENTIDPVPQIYRGGVRCNDNHLHRPHRAGGMVQPPRDLGILRRLSGRCRRQLCPELPLYLQQHQTAQGCLAQVHGDTGGGHTAQHRLDVLGSYSAFHALSSGSAHRCSSSPLLVVHRQSSLGFCLNQLNQPPSTLSVKRHAS